ncbi:MAG: hypothetical protein ABIT05_15370 [Chitinophagaceae bacterium]
MKVVHLNKENPAPDLLEEAAKLEKLILRQPTNAAACNRLMAIYRKLKDPGKELKVINKVIKAFEAKFQTRIPGYDKKVIRLSKALRKMTGLADEKGNNLYQWGDLGKWKKRKELILKKLSKGS